MLAWVQLLTGFTVDSLDRALLDRASTHRYVETPRLLLMKCSEFGQGNEVFSPNRGSVCAFVTLQRAASLLCCEKTAKNAMVQDTTHATVLGSTELGP